MSISWDKNGFSSCGKFCVQHTNSSAGGPWYVQYDPEGENAGWSDILFDYCRSRREAREKVEDFLRNKISDEDRRRQPYFQKIDKRTSCQTCGCQRFACGGEYCKREHEPHKKPAPPTLVVRDGVLEVIAH